MSFVKQANPMLGYEFRATRPGREVQKMAKWNFAVDGGAATAIIPAINETLPAGAVVIYSMIRVIVAVLSGGSATLTIGTDAGSSATSLLGSTGKASLTLGALIVGAAGAAPFVMTAKGKFQFTIGTSAATAGRIECYTKYLLPSE